MVNKKSLIKRKIWIILTVLVVVVNLPFGVSINSDKMNQVFGGVC